MQMFMEERCFDSAILGHAMRKKKWAFFLRLCHRYQSTYNYPMQLYANLVLFHEVIKSHCSFKNLFLYSEL